MDKLYKMNIEFRRGGELTGLFIEDKDIMDFAIGKRIYFGEVMGKHSDVDIELKDYHIKELNVPLDIVDILKNELGTTISGYNPIEYMYLKCENKNCNWESRVSEALFYTDFKHVYCDECITDEEKKYMCKI